MSIRLILRGKVKDDVSSEAFGDFARRAAKFSEEDSGVIAHSFFIDDNREYWEEHVFTDEGGFFAHFGPATEAGIIDEYMALVDIERVLVLDPVNDEMKSALEPWGAVQYAMVAGF